MLPVAGWATAAPEPVFIVDGVTTTIASGEPLGVARAGLLCLPARRITLRSILADGRMDQREVAAQALEEAGLRFFSSSSQAAGRGLSRYRVHGTVRALVFDVCDRRGGAGRYSGTARADILWRVQGYDSQADDFRFAVEVTHDIDRDAATSLGEIYRALLADGARMLADRLKRGRDG